MQGNTKLPFNMGTVKQNVLESAYSKMIHNGYTVDEALTFVHHTGVSAEPNTGNHMVGEYMVSLSTAQYRMLVQTLNKWNKSTRRYHA